MDNNFLPRRGQSGQNKQRPLRPTAQHWERPTTFRTPEEIASDDMRREAVATGDTGYGYDMGNATAPPPKQKKSLKAWLKGLSKKQLILLITAAIIVLGGIGAGAYFLFIKDDVKAPVKKKTVKQAPAPKPAEPVLSTLTGLPLSDPTINQRPVTAVMIENSPDARPQAGLNQAGVVFEAIAEGGITRFLTLFQDSEPDYIGPVRSVRPYYIQWLAGFDAAVAHVGGSADALQMLRNGEAKDLDQFFNTGPYRRVSNRVAPHNMYSNVAKLRELQNQKGYSSNYTGFARKPEAKSQTPNPTSIDFNISGALYNPHYDYDAATNTYKRSEGGKPHIDEKSGQQLAPKVVIALVMAQGRNGVYTTYNTLGSGEAVIFQDGIAIRGTWHKAGNKEQFTFTDANGPVKLNPGQTWLSVVGSSDRISYK